MSYKSKINKSENSRAYYCTHRQELLARKKAWRETHRKEASARDKAYYMAHKEKITKYRKENRGKENERSKGWRKANLERARANVRAYHASCRKTDLLYRFKRSVCRLVRNSFCRKGFRKDTKTFQVLGCTSLEFRGYIKSLFGPGMTFENHGEWHIDHIVPLATARAAGDVVRLCHHTNLQPLWKEENLRKGCRSGEIENGS